MKLLFISHDASRTGAPILLLNLLRLLEGSGGFESTVLLRNGGPLESEFSHLVETFIWNKPEQALKKRNVFERLLHRSAIHRDEDQRKAEILEEVRKSDVIINNTITNGELLAIVVKGFNGKIISYIHELKTASRRFATTLGIDLTIRLSERFIIPSEAVKQYLEQNYQVASQKIFDLNYYLPDKAPATLTETKNDYNNKKFIVGGCGTADWRKGIDIFISVARYLKGINCHNQFSFIWKGINAESKEYGQCKYDIQKSGLDDMIILSATDNKMVSFYNNIDVFFLSSREDPYPLVILEAASFGKPSICFEEAGGAPEFVQEDAGSVVPYLDIAAVANVLLEYRQNPEKLLRKGQTAKARLKMLHQNKSLILEQFNQLLKN